MVILDQMQRHQQCSGATFRGHAVARLAPDQACLTTCMTPAYLSKQLHHLLQLRRRRHPPLPPPHHENSPCPGLPTLTDFGKSRHPQSAVIATPSSCTSTGTSAVSADWPRTKSVSSL